MIATTINHNFDISEQTYYRIFCDTYNTNFEMSKLFRIFSSNKFQIIFHVI